MRDFVYKMVHIPSGLIEEKKMQCWNEEEFKNRINNYNRLATIGVKSPIWLYYWE